MQRGRSRKRGQAASLPTHHWVALCALTKPEATSVPPADSATIKVKVSLESGPVLSKLLFLAVLITVVTAKI